MDTQGMEHYFKYFGKMKELWILFFTTEVLNFRRGLFKAKVYMYKMKIDFVERSGSDLIHFEWIFTWDLDIFPQDRYVHEFESSQQRNNF